MGDLLVILIDCMIFLSQFVDIIRVSISTVTVDIDTLATSTNCVLHTARQWNSVPRECFPLTYDQMALKCLVTIKNE